MIFLPQSCLDVHASEASLLNNGKVCEEFDEDDHYIGLGSNCPPTSSHVAVDYYEGYMFIVHFGS